MEMKGSEINLDQLVEEFKYIIKVPEMAKAAKRFISHTKFDFEDQYNLYNNLREKFREKQLGQMYVLGNSSNNAPSQMFRFEIQWNSIECWTLSALEPAPPSGSNVNSIFPPLLIQYIGNYKGEKNKIHSDLKSIKVDGKKETFDIQFAYCSDRHIMGTISKKSESEDRGKKSLEKLNPLNHEKIDNSEAFFYKPTMWGNSEKNDEEMFTQLFSAMARDPFLKQSIFRFYYSKLRQVTEKEKIKLSE